VRSTSLKSTRSNAERKRAGTKGSRTRRKVTKTTDQSARSTTKRARRRAQSRTGRTKQAGSGVRPTRSRTGRSTTWRSKEGPSVRDVIHVLSQVRGRSATLATIARRLGIKGRRRSSLRELLDVLLEEGRLAREKGGRYALPEAPPVVHGRYRGRGRGHGGSRGGYGFITRDDGGPDLYVSQENAGSALNGDEVSAAVRWPAAEEGPAGAVIGVERRAREAVVGTFRELAEGGVVEPRDRRIAARFRVSERARRGAREGDLVVAHVVEWPGEGRSAEAEVTEIIGPPGAPGTDGAAIAKSFGFAMEFPPDALEEAEALPEVIAEEDLRGRRDLRDALTYTIDPERAQDFDDAISVERTERGFRIGVHIADVSHYVGEGSAIDEEARKRGTSVYLVDRTIHMLPARISSELASLKSGADRLTRTVELEIDDAGKVRTHRQFRSVIRSRARLTYEEAQELIDSLSKGSPAPRSKPSPGGGSADFRCSSSGGTGAAAGEIAESLGLAASVAQRLREQRMARGSLDLPLPEFEIDLDDDGHVRGVRKVGRLASHRLIEEFMIAANEAIAKGLRAKGLPVLYRVHEPPAREKIEALASAAGSLGYQFAARAQGTGPFQRLLRLAAGTGEEVLIATLVLRSMKRARYAVDNVGHFALASRCYTHFTSPIRRYPDLCVHRLLGRRRPRKEGEPAALRKKLERVALLSTEQEWHAEAAERLSVRSKIIESLTGRVGEEVAAIVTKVFPSGMFVYLEEVDLESFVQVESLGDDYYRYNRHSQSLVGRRTGRRFGLGERVELCLARVDLDAEELELVLAAP
jgi:ribonuclease R